jgi:hypothetical protein
MLEEACAALGIELFRRGGPGHQTTDPRGALAEADVVIGYGRAILEAMSCGRAAFVYDWAGGSGWVTAESYPAIEAGGFAGRDSPAFTTTDLTAALGRYDRAMGPVNHDLVIANHRANVHAQELIGLFERLGPKELAPRTALDDMARLVRLEWRARAQVNGLQVENAELHRRLGEIGVRLTNVDEAWKAELERREAAEQASDAARREVEATKHEAAAVGHSYERTLSWRLTRPLRSLGGMRRFR